LVRFCGSSGGVGCVAACCMTFVTVSIAKSRPSEFFSLICRFTLLAISSPYFSQLVLWLCSLGVFYLFITDVLIVVRMGV
jgi:hypothetical protein